MKKSFIVFLYIGLLVGCAKTKPEVIPSLTPQPSPIQTQTSEPMPTSTRTIKPSPSPEPECVAVSGHIEESNYPGVVVEGYIPLRMYLPPCYKEEALHYPILYVLHGYPMDEMHWDELGIVQVVEQGIQDGRWEPFLIAMPRIPDPLNTQSDGGPDSYEEEMLAGLVPYVEGNYRTVGSRGYHAIAGVSRGGVWALEIGLRNTDWFDIVVSLSPALHVNRARPAYDPYYLIQTIEDLPKHIFLSAAENEGAFRTKTEELSDLMDTIGIPHTYLLTEGVHEDATWMAIMDEVILFITQAWDKPQEN